MAFVERLLLDENGKLLWQGDPSHVPDSRHLEGTGAHDVVRSLCGRKQQRWDGRKFITEQAVARAAEAFGLISLRGCTPGFVTLLPAGVHLERCSTAFNIDHARDLDVVDVEFPSVFDRSREDIAALTADYDGQKRMFRVQDRTDALRLSYAADPGLFGLLRGTCLPEGFERLAIRSNTTIFRRYRSGELGPLTKVRQYSLPDLHVICPPEGAWDESVRLTATAARSIRFWESSAVAQFIDVVSDFYARHENEIRSLASAASMPTIINILDRESRYYSMRTGLCADAGTGALMLYNMQWDEVNSHRFDISISHGGRPIVLHANFLAGSGLMCLLLGRSLAADEAMLPPEVCRFQATLLVLSPGILDSAQELADRWLTLGLSLQIVLVDEPLSKAIKRWSKPWLPPVAVFGPKEAAGDSIQLRIFGTTTLMDEAEFRNRYAERVRRCLPIELSNPWPADVLPFA
jgi:threonyl-tRNA synthetase